MIVWIVIAAVVVVCLAAARVYDRRHPGARFRNLHSQFDIDDEFPGTFRNDGFYDRDTGTPDYDED